MLTQTVPEVTVVVPIDISVGKVDLQPPRPPATVPPSAGAAKKWGAGAVPIMPGVTKAQPEPERAPEPVQEIQYAPAEVAEPHAPPQQVQPFPEFQL